MTSLPRALLLAAVLVAAFLLGALTLQRSIARQMHAVQADSIAEARRALTAALALAPREPARWDAEYLAALSAVTNGRVELRRAADRAAAPAAPDAPAAASFAEELPGQPAWLVHVALAPREVERLRRLQSSTFAATIMLALVLGSVPVVIALVGARRSAGDTRAPWRAEAAGYERFARLTVERGAALERAEQDLHVSRSLLDRSLEERVRLGRELHDNVSQTLYGVSLALESVRKKMTAAPEIEQRLDQCVAELRRLNQETRAFLRELEPAHVQQAPLAHALAAALATPVAGEARIETQLDEAALAALPAAHAPELVNLVREAISNAVRHGAARLITVRAGRTARGVELEIADDGHGFAPHEAARLAGHGLANMRARAAALGGELHLESAPAKGTRVRVILPVESAPA